MEKGLMARDEWHNLGLNFSEDEMKAAKALPKGP